MFCGFIDTLLGLRSQQAPIDSKEILYNLQEFNKLSFNLNFKKHVFNPTETKTRQHEHTYS